MTILNSRILSRTSRLWESQRVITMRLRVHVQQERRLGYGRHSSPLSVVVGCLKLHISLPETREVWMCETLLAR